MSVSSLSPLIGRPIIERQIEAAHALYAVRKNSPELWKYLESVHHFFFLLNAEYGARETFFVCHSKNEDEPLRLIAFLTREFACAKSVSLSYITDDYVGIGGMASEEMRAMDRALTAVQNTFKAIIDNPISNADPFPYHVIPAVARETVCALSPFVSERAVNIFADASLEVKMAEARSKYTSFEAFDGVAAYMFAVDTFYNLLEEDCKSNGAPVFYKPKPDQGFGLITFLELNFAEINNLIPQFISSDYQGVGDANTPLARQMSAVHRSYEAMCRKNAD